MKTNKQQIRHSKIYLKKAEKKNQNVHVLVSIRQTTQQMLRKENDTLINGKCSIRSIK